MRRKGEVVPLEQMIPEDERAYWDAHDPLRQGKRARIYRLQPPEDRLSYFALRLSGRDINRLAELAQKQGMKPSELARALILRGLEQLEKGVEGQNLEKRVEVLEMKLSQMENKTDASAEPGKMISGREAVNTHEIK